MKRYRISRIYYITIITLLLISLLLGYVFFSWIKSNSDYDYMYILSNFKQGLSNYYALGQGINIFIVALAIVLSFTPIGVLIIVLLELYSFFSLGFIINMFISVLGYVSLGMLIPYSLLYIIVPGIILIVEGFYILRMSLYFISKFFKSNTTPAHIERIVKRLLTIGIIYLVYETLIIIFGGKVLQLIAF